MLTSKCGDTECHNYNEKMQYNCNMYAWDYVEECHEPEVYRKCANCGKEMNMGKKEYKTLMDGGRHRYVCSSECMVEYYHQ